MWGFARNSRVDMEGDQNMPLWHMDYFEVKEIENQQAQKEAFLKFSLSSNFWEIKLPQIPSSGQIFPRRRNESKIYPTSLLWGSFMALNETESPFMFV